MCLNTWEFLKINTAMKGKCDNDLMMMSACCYGSSEMQVPTPQLYAMIQIVMKVFGSSDAFM